MNDYTIQVRAEDIKMKMDEIDKIVFKFICEAKNYLLRSVFYTIGNTCVENYFPNVVVVVILKGDIERVEKQVLDELLGVECSLNNPKIVRIKSVDYQKIEFRVESSFDYALRFNRR